MLELDQVSKRLGSFQPPQHYNTDSDRVFMRSCRRERSRKDITSAYAARIIPAG